MHLDDDDGRRRKEEEHGGAGHGRGSKDAHGDLSDLRVACAGVGLGQTRVPGRVGKCSSSRIHTSPRRRDIGR